MPYTKVIYNNTSPTVLTIAAGTVLTLLDQSTFLVSVDFIRIKARAVILYPGATITLDFFRFYLWGDILLISFSLILAILLFFVLTIYSLYNRLHKRISDASDVSSNGSFPGRLRGVEFQS
jgi:hypothetical protein